MSSDLLSYVSLSNKVATMPVSLNGSTILSSFFIELNMIIAKNNVYEWKKASVFRI